MEYAERWYRETEGRHKPKYRKLNRGYLDRQIAPTIGDEPLATLTAQQVRGWFAGLDTKYPTRNANAYGLLRTILNQAVDDELISVNPCRIKGAAMKHRVREPIALTAREIRSLADGMPAKWKVLVLVAGFSGLRWGELTALRRRDLDLTGDGAAVSVRRAVVRVKGAWIVGRPKSKAALRTVPLPDPLRPELVKHLKEHSAPGASGLVFPAVSTDFLHRDNVREALKRGARKLGYDNIVPHDLRHSAATLFAEAGATLADHMTLMGHTSAAMSARYTHSTAGRTRGLVQSTWDRDSDAR
ncbi:tyrosine-type recombinase/integrase [Nocardia otitidiscaviarum]|uniref:tyrosine-type recombinase/integrase n=1 Tax=Nocardia otitidiscaviarum TaxID=1823 RepID=UPI0024589130|nr:site-specific integrase [Nocardia otitidiscaviarum]